MWSVSDNGNWFLEFKIAQMLEQKMKVGLVELIISDDYLFKLKYYKNASGSRLDYLAYYSFLIIIF